MPEFGVYIVGNDPVIENCLALAHSFRKNSPSTKLCLIPYDDKYEKVLKKLSKFNVILYPDMKFIKELQSSIDYLFGGEAAPGHKHKRNRLRNLVSWVGPFDNFLYMDVDIIVFRDLYTFTKDYFEKYDFFSCDRQYKNGLRWVFTPKIYSVFDKKSVVTFNAGFWGSKRNVFTREQLLGEIADCRDCYRFFDFESGALAQPIINYLVHKNIEEGKRGNILNVEKEMAEPWAGLKDLVIEEHMASANGCLLPFLHWAGKEIGRKGLYSDLWSYYRDLY